MDFGSITAIVGLTRFIPT